MKHETIMRVTAFVTGIISMVMFYQVGGWMLPVAMLFFGWSLNLDNSLKKYQ